MFFMISGLLIKKTKKQKNWVTMLKYLWCICVDIDQSVCYSWVCIYMIRNKNICELKIIGDCSWA
jgi:surface polysaccharide O-acyltransferase-like enzyme